MHIAWPARFCVRFMRPTRASTHHPPILQQRSLTCYMHMARTLLRPIAGHTCIYSTHHPPIVQQRSTAVAHVLYAHGPHTAASDCGPRASLSPPCHRLTWHTCTGTHTKRHMRTSACLPHTELPGSRLRHTHMPFVAAALAAQHAGKGISVAPLPSAHLAHRHCLTGTCTGAHTERHIGMPPPPPHHTHTAHRHRLAGTCTGTHTKRQPGSRHHKTGKSGPFGSASHPLAQ